MILPDHEIERRCDPNRFKIPLVSPFKLDNLQPASMDLTLARDFLIPESGFPVDLANVKAAGGYRIYDVDQFRLTPQLFILGSTVETISVPASMVGRVEGKSSLGRLGLLVHSTAGFIDPGFSGTITLEFYNLSQRTIILRSGLRIAQISFTELSNPAKKPYGHEALGSKYQGQSETTASRYAG